MASLPPFSSVVPRHRAQVRSPEFHHFLVLTRSFFGTCPNPSPVLARKLLLYSSEPFSGTGPNFTHFRYLPGTVSGTRPELLRYLPEPFSGTCPEPSPVLVRIFPVFGTRPNFTRFRYSPGPFSGTRPNFTRFR